ncbi:hypothetical protein CRI94_00590 [Longibacter salinarum]|uniref:Uncharacterized protein n=2 Tax=Longibacter salinarum TaxID=1850348 RepID=A0A2A8D2F2_9BACT|nr:hypothetical protein CRI94_00590 [Longibacter salinarum]
MTTAEAVRPWLLSVVLAPLIAYIVYGYAAGIYTVFDTASLLIHEAGHFFFRPFGWALFLLGGSLYQLILPGLFVWTFLRSEYPPGVQVSCVWLGQNAMNVATYIADARDRSLPLITGDVNSHDWWQLLGAAGLLPYDDLIAAGVVVIGMVAFTAALLAPRWMWT